MCGPPHGDGLQLATDDFVFITTEMLRILKPDTRVISGTAFLSSLHRSLTFFLVMEGGYDVSEATNALGKCFDAHLRTLLGLEWNRAAASSPKRRRILVPNEDEDVDIMGDGDDHLQAVVKRRARSKSPQPPSTSPNRRRAKSRSPSPVPTSKKRSPSPELVRANSSFI